MFENVLSFQARYRPEAIALATSSGQATFAELSGTVDRFAARLRAHVRQGTHVTVQAHAIGLHWTLLLALAKLGCATSSLPARGERPAGSLVEALAADLLVTDQLTADHTGSVLLLTPEWISAAYQGIVEPIASYRFGPKEAVRVVLSSGTTGAPKKMILNRSVVDARIRSAGLSRLAHRRLHSRVGVDAETGYRAPLTAWATGAAVLYPDEGVASADFLLASRVETLLLVPAQLQALLAELPENFSPPRDLEIVVVSGALPRTLYEQAVQRLTDRIYVVYGSTEAGLVAQLSPDLQSDGRTMNGIVSASAEVEIAGPDGGVLPFGTTGLVRVRTEEMVDGYAGNDELTRIHFREGWFYPGDFGVLDGLGGLVIQGRETEILDLGGLRLAPDLVEAIILRCPGVQNAAAFSAANPAGLHSAHAAVVGDERVSMDAIASLLAYELPQVAIALHRVPAIPRSDRGKILRQELTTRCGLTEIGSPE